MFITIIIVICTPCSRFFCLFILFFLLFLIRKEFYLMDKRDFYYYSVTSKLHIESCSWIQLLFPNTGLQKCPCNETWLSAEGGGVIPNNNETACRIEEMIGVSTVQIRIRAEDFTKTELWSMRRRRFQMDEKSSIRWCSGGELIRGGMILTAQISIPQGEKLLYLILK